MKKVLFLLLTSLFTMTALAQTQNADEGVMPINKQGTQSELLVPADGGYMLGDRYMNKQQYKEFLATSCPEAYNRYCNADKYWKVGSSFLGIGVPCIVASIVTGVIGAVQYIDRVHPVETETLPEFNETEKALNTASIVTGAIGSAFTVAAIPIMIVNGVRRSNAYNVYNQKCVNQKPAAVLNFQADEAGVGLALQF